MSAILPAVKAGPMHLNFNPDKEDFDSRDFSFLTSFFPDEGKRDIESARDSVIIFNMIQFFCLNLQFTLIYGLFE